MAARSTGGPLGTFALTPMHVAPKEPAKAGAKATRTEFGIDIGSAATLEALRTQWQTIRRAHPKLLEGMRPLVSIHDVAKRRTVEVHLLIGPIADAKAAARHCAALVSAGLSSCKTTEFEGQRLVIR